MIKAFAPANISLIFQTFEHTNPRFKGSFGLGFTVNEGVYVTASKAKKTEIFFNDQKINLPTVENVIRKLLEKYSSSERSESRSNIKQKFSTSSNSNIKIDISSKLPLGCGFGISGAATLATAFAVNKLFTLNKSDKQLAILAHTAEVEEQTGLGDVINQFFGGFLLKTKPSSYFVVNKLPINNIPIYYKVFGEIKTKSIISNSKQLEKINKIGVLSLKQIENLIAQKNASLPKILDISKEFAIKSGLLKQEELITMINKIEQQKGHATMIMLGNSLLSDMPFEGCKKLIISKNKACLL